MDNRKSLNRRFKRIATNILSIFAVLALTVPATGGVFAEDGSPYLRAFPDRDSVDGGNWPLGASVHMEIDDPSNGLGTDYQQDAIVIVSPGDPNATYVVFDFSYDLKIGDIVRLTSDSLMSEHTVPFLTITTIDADNDIVAGKADPGVPVHVFSGPNANVYTYADNTTGDWVVDFTGQLDLIPGTSGGVDMQASDGDSAIFDWSVPLPPPSPWLIAFPENDAVEAWEWPDGTIVYLTIDDLTTPDNPDYAQEGVMDVTSWGDPRTYMRFEFSYNLKPGDVVMVTDLKTTRTHVVQNLSVTAVDEVAETVTGTADTGAVVDIWPHGADQIATVSVTAVEGAWTAEFAGLFDLAPGVGGRSRILDSEGNYTAVDWGVPNLRFTIFPEWEWMDGYDWPDGTVSVTVVGKEKACSTDKTSSGGFFNGAFPEGCDVMAGDLVTFDYGAMHREHTVRNLAITSVDETSDTVTGTSDPFALVIVWPHETGQQVQISADQYGDWQASVAPYDIVPGSAGRAEIRDDIGNGTAVDWYVPVPPNPWFGVFVEGEIVEAWDWPLDATVHLTIDDPATADNPDFYQDGIVILTPWGSGQHWVWFEWGDAYDMKPGDIVTLTDDVTERVHIVQNLSVTNANPDENTVGGTALPGMNVTLWSWEDPEGRRLEVTADDLGFWTADFDDVGFDLLPGYTVRAEVWVEGNNTAVDRQIPNPRVAVYLEAEFVIGWDWPHGAGVHMTIDDPTNGEGIDFEQDGIVEPTPFDPNTWWAMLDFAGVYNVKPGDIVVLTDGITTREHIVLSLTVDEINGEADTVAGTSFAGANIFVHPWDAWFDPIGADESGTWIMDFNNLYDLVPGTWGIAEVFDDANNSTAIDWTVPLPIQIDIQPWNSSNLVPCRATGDLLPVAVFSTSTFDATAVDHDSVRFGRTGVEAEVVKFHDWPLRYARDINHDGLVDMVYTFRFSDTGFSCKDVPAGQHSVIVRATLTGWMGNIFLEGMDNLMLIYVGQKRSGDRGSPWSD